MDMSRILGGLVCVGTLVLGAAFVWGIYLQSYWAVAVPVIVGFLGVLTLSFWIGWTMAATATEAPGPQPEE